MRENRIVFSVAGKTRKETATKKNKVMLKLILNRTESVDWIHLA
jgi:hypothetical protein